MKPVAVALAILVAIQFVPYGRHHSNPPVIQEPKWDSAATRAIAQRACFDCHSNQTVWPEYARVAPISWLLQADVEDGRAALNFSEWQRPQEHADEAAEVVRRNEMPLLLYRVMHSGGRLTDAERERLAQGLERTVAALGPGLVK